MITFSIENIIFQKGFIQNNLLMKQFSNQIAIDIPQTIFKLIVVVFARTEFINKPQRVRGRKILIFEIEGHSQKSLT